PAQPVANALSNLPELVIAPCIPKRHRSREIEALLWRGPPQATTAHKRLDDSAQGADFLFGCPHAREHGTQIVHHAGAFFGRGEEPLAFELVLDVLKKALKLRLGGGRRAAHPEPRR